MFFSKKCEYCRKKVDAGIERSVKVPGYVGTFEKTFCSSEHADAYEEELANKRSSGKGCGSCCG